VELTKQQWFSQTRFLQQRGFNGEMIKNLFDRLGLKLIYS
jgi:SOS response regulatory protein OraA/RecX